MSWTQQSLQRCPELAVYRVSGIGYFGSVELRGSTPGQAVVRRSPTYGAAPPG